jgi:3-hydroxybutyryl-CoA dehydrogenase
MQAGGPPGPQPSPGRNVASRNGYPGGGTGGRAGPDPVRCPDRPGLLAGALIYPHLADAVRIVQDGYARAADIDTAMTAGCGYPRGPLQLLDDRGAGVVLAGPAAMHGWYGDAAFAPPPLLREHAAAALGFCG